MIQNIEEASAGDVVIIRSHGEPESFYRTAEEKGVALVDSTCVFVTKIHDIVHKAHAEEKGIIIVGNPEHQEVIATNGWCDYRGHILQNREDAEALTRNHPELFQAGRKPVIVCQTTFKVEILEEILGVFKDKNCEYELYNTICSATRERQDACRDLAQKVELMVVIGDRHSSNSRKLFEIAKENCKIQFLYKIFQIYS